MPKPVKPFLIGEDPKLELKRVLEEYESEAISNRERLLLALLESSDLKQKPLLEKSFQEPEFEQLRQNILKGIHEQ